MKRLAFLQLEEGRLPLGAAEMQWLADALSTLACEYRKGEHQHSGTIEIGDSAR